MEYSSVSPLPLFPNPSEKNWGDLYAKKYYKAFNNSNCLLLSRAGRSETECVDHIYRLLFTAWEKRLAHSEWLQIIIRRREWSEIVDRGEVREAGGKVYSMRFSVFMKLIAGNLLWNISFCAQITWKNWELLWNNEVDGRRFNVDKMIVKINTYMVLDRA